MRELDVTTLDAAAKDYAANFLFPSRFSKSHPEGSENPVAIGGREWTMQCLYNAHYMDEFDHLVATIKRRMGRDTLEEFEAEAAERFTPREASVFEGLLAEKLAITPDGEHIPGKIGTVQVGGRRVGKHIVTVETSDSIQRRKVLGAPKQLREVEQRVVSLNWPVYAGEEVERDADSGVADPLPSASLIGRLLEDESGTLVTNVSIAFAQAAANASVDLLDEGTADGMLEGRDDSAAQPVDPDAATVGVLLFSLDLGTPAFGAATDGAPGGLKTANAIADDTSADATGTLDYCRASSSNAFPTPLNSHIDGHCDLAGGDFNWNTLAIVSGATVSMTGWTFTIPQGPTAT